MNAYATGNRLPALRLATLTPAGRICQAVWKLRDFWWKIALFRIPQGRLEAMAGYKAGHKKPDVTLLSIFPY